MTFAPHLTILGGGPSGLAAGAAARERGLEAIVLEAAERVGGNCRTIRVGDFSFDTGAHRVHDKDPEVTNWLTGRLGEALREVEAPSRIWDDGRWLGFPITAGEMVRHLGMAASAGAALDLATRRLRSRSAPVDFEDFALRAYGRPVAERFLLNYSEKLWGASCRRLSVEIAGARLAGLDLRSFASETLFGRNGRARHVEGRFLYPRGGIEAVADTMAEACGRDRIRTKTAVTGIEHAGGRIRAVRTGGDDRLPVDQVISSLPMSVLVEMLDPPPSDGVVSAARTLRFRHVVLVALFIDRPSLTDAATVYFPDRRFEFTRLCEPRNRCPTMAPDDRTSVVAEIPCFAGDTAWTMSDDEAIALVGRRLTDAGWFAAGEIAGGAVRRLTNAYPVLETGAGDAAAEIRSHLGGLRNLRLVGRNGTFTYGWIHDMVRGGWRAIAELEAL